FCYTLTPTTHLSPLSLHDALPILAKTTSSRPSPSRSTVDKPPSNQEIEDTGRLDVSEKRRAVSKPVPLLRWTTRFVVLSATSTRSEEHTSELQSLAYLVCRLLLEK